jgi:hypothetical protein
MRITRANPGKSVDYLADVNALVADASTEAPGVGLTPQAVGDRYILIANAGSLHANWKTISGVGNNDIVECFGSAGSDELVLIDGQLIDGAAGCILQAELFSIAVNPTANDTFIVTDGTTTETFTFKAARAVAFDVAIGLDAAATLVNLVAAINSDSTLWSALDTVNLSAYFAGAYATQAVICRTAYSAAADRLYGSLTAADGIKVVSFAGATQDYTVAAGTEANLPATDPAAKRFGFGRAYASLTALESHSNAETGWAYEWNATTEAWDATMYWDVDWDASGAGAGAIVWDLDTVLWYEWNGTAWHSLPALKYYKGTTTYAGAVPSATEMNAFLPALHDFGHFQKGATDSVFFVHRHSLASGGAIADFSWTEMAPTPNRAITTIETSFTFATASPITIATGLKAGDLLLGSKLMITTVFDDAAATISIGTTNLGATVLHDVIHNNPQALGTYETQDIVAVTMADNVTLTLTPGASTTGAGTAVVSIKRA